MKSFNDQINELDELDLEDNQYSEVHFIISKLYTEIHSRDKTIESAYTIVKDAETYKNGCLSVETYLKTAVAKNKK